MSAPKLTSMPWNGTLNSPQYQIAYSTVGNQATSQNRSRALLARLVGDHGLIIELNDSLLCAPEKQRPAIGETFRAAMAAQNLVLTERRYPSTVKPSFFARLLGQGEQVDACELRALVPNPVWRSAVLDPALTAFGLRYYVLPDQADGPGLLERMNLGTISSQELIATMDLIIFDCPCFGQMGLISTVNEVSALKARLAD